MNDKFGVSLETTEAVLFEMAQQQGHELNGQEAAIHPY